MYCMVDTHSLRERAKQLRKLADTLDTAAAGLEEIGGQPTEVAGMYTLPRRDSLSIAQASSRDLCFAVLREAGRPLSREQMMARLHEAKRMVTPGTLQSYLSRDKRLMSLGRGVWSLRPASEQRIAIARNEHMIGGE
jgi:hypothetical protein